ncbi:hypothetical protein Ancab_027705 [Ancistrocladus abbreviatus]
MSAAALSFRAGNLWLKFRPVVSHSYLPTPWFIPAMIALNLLGAACLDEDTIEAKPGSGNRFLFLKTSLLGRRVVNLSPTSQLLQLDEVVFLRVCSLNNEVKAGLGCLIGLDAEISKFSSLP